MSKRNKMFKLNSLVSKFVNLWFVTGSSVEFWAKDEATAKRALESIEKAYESGFKAGMKAGKKPVKYWRNTK